MWAIGRVSGAGLAPSPLVNANDYPMRAGNYNLTEAIAELPGDLPHPAPAAKLVIDHASDISQGLGQALGEHRDVVVSVLADLDALLGGHGLARTEDGEALLVLHVVQHAGLDIPLPEPVLIVR